MFFADVSARRAGAASRRRSCGACPKAYPPHGRARGRRDDAAERGDARATRVRRGAASAAARGEEEPVDRSCARGTRRTRARPPRPRRARAARGRRAAARRRGAAARTALAGPRARGYVVWRRAPTRAAASPPRGAGAARARARADARPARAARTAAAAPRRGALRGRARCVAALLQQGGGGELDRARRSLARSSATRAGLSLTWPASRGGARRARRRRCRGRPDLTLRLGGSRLPRRRASRWRLSMSPAARRPWTWTTCAPWPALVRQL